MRQRHERTERATTGGLEARLRAARSRSFVGRQAELDLFRAAVEADIPPFAVLHLHGPGGVGKTALLRRFADEGRALGREPVVLDGRDFHPSPDGFLAALGSALDVAARDAVGALVEQDAPLLIVDTVELLGPLDGWIRDVLLPQLPATAFVVLAGRTPPAPAWRADPAWDELLRVVALRDLHAADARALLEARGIDRARHEEVLRVTRGHPLALVLVAEVVGQQASDVPVALGDAPAVIEQLLERFLHQLPSAAHRRALHAAAQAGIATEALVRDTVDGAPPGELFDWLNDLSFTEPVAAGVAVHDLVSDALNAELRWRDPDGYVALHEAVSRHFERRVARTRGAEQQRAMLDALRLYRLHPVTRPFFDWERTCELWLEPARPGDHATIIALAREHEGDASAELARYWLDRQPEAFTVFRGATTHEPAGFVAHLLLGDTPGEEVTSDPVAAAVWDHIRSRAPLRSGERVRIVRFWIAADTYQGTATHHLVSARSSVDWVTTERLAWSFVVLADPTAYEPIFTFIDFERPAELEVTIGDRRFGMFARDLRATSAEAWNRLLRERRASATRDLAELPGRRAPLLVLAHDDFADAVREALRGVSRPGGLAANPLLHSSVVVDHAAGRPAEDALAELLQQAADELSTHPRDDKLRRALELTYLRPAPTQEAAAERLGLPFSTFRRHLTGGIERVTAWLWERELHGHQS